MPTFPLPIAAPSEPSPESDDPPGACGTSAAPPKSIQINLLNACAQRCVMCRKYDWPRDVLPAEVVLSVLDAVSPHTTVILSGGDPVLHPAFADVVRRLDERGLAWAMLTNAMVFADGADSARYLNISFDGVRPETYRAVRGVDAFDRVRGNIDRYRARYPDKPILLDTTVSRHNVRELVDLLAFAAERSMEINFELVHTFDDLRPTDDELAEVAARAFRFLAAHKVQTNFFIFAHQAAYGFLRSQTCSVLDHHCVIDADGNVFPCCRSMNDNGAHGGRSLAHALGNVRETPFDQLWAARHRGGRLDGLRAKGAEFCKSCDRYAMFNHFTERYVAATPTFL